jgi:pimeloyl-ACP methyl ester carboxylesterase
MFLTSSDDTRIAYDVQGEGPALLLFQGFDEMRQIWHDLGYVERLSKHFRVITMDRRGIGESDHPEDPKAYSVEKMMADVYAVADACQAAKFLVWGHSFGGTLALQLAARSERITRAIVAGSFFGRIYFKERVDQITSDLRTLDKAQKEGQLKELGMDAEDIRWVEERHLPALIACWQALISWPILNDPHEIRCPLYIYSGTNDRRITQPLLARQDAIDDAGILLRIFDQLDHSQEISAIDIVYPPAENFLREPAGTPT